MSKYLPCLVSNSSCKVFRECERKFYLTHLYDGTGLSTTLIDPDLAFGAAIHELFPQLWAEDFSGIAGEREKLEVALLSDPIWYRNAEPTFRAMKACEYGRLLAASARTVARYMIPHMRSRYRLIMVEKSMLKWQDPGRFGYLSKPDMILEGIEGTTALPGLTYAEWKSSSTLKLNFHHQWRNNPQTWLGAITAQAELGLKIDHFQVIGVLKGSKGENGFRSSPLIWAWKQIEPSGKETKADGTSVVDAFGVKWSWAGTTAKGWVRTSTDEFAGGVEAWVAALPLSMIHQQTCLTEAVPIDDALANEWLANQRRLIAAVEALDAAGPAGEAEVLARDFPRQLDMCESGRYGKPCHMREICHNGIVAANPLDYGYIKRVSHHSIEREAQR